MNEFSFILPGTVTHLSSAVKHFATNGKAIMLKESLEFLPLLRI
jgi:hypothetical protein